MYLIKIQKQQGIILIKLKYSFWDDINEQQYEVLKKFREKIVSDNICENPDIFKETFLLSYCRARKFDLEKMMIMFANYVKWRKENNVDEIEVIYYFIK